MAIFSETVGYEILEFTSDVLAEPKLRINNLLALQNITDAEFANDNGDIISSITVDFNLTTKDYQGKDVNVTFDMQLSFRWVSNNR